MTHIRILVSLNLFSSESRLCLVRDGGEGERKGERNGGREKGRREVWKDLGARKEELRDEGKKGGKEVDGVKQTVLYI